MQVVVASNNAHKIQEIRTALDFPGWEFVPLKAVASYPEPEEDGETFLDNARIKARAAHEATGMPALADDSGLVVDALDGAPGVRSARFAGDHGDDGANNRLLLEMLDGVPDEQRSARFVSVLVFIDADGAETVARGTVEGHIGYTEVGDEGFGYDPIFHPDVFGGTITMAQVSMEQKNAVSHRGNALRNLKEQLLAMADSHLRSS